MRYAVVACSQCRAPWLVELRHRTGTCPGCQTRVDLGRRRRLWQGDDLRAAQAAVGAHRAAMAQGIEVAEVARFADRPLVRHDSPVDAAAAKGKTVRNMSARCDEVGLWLTRLEGPAPHDTWVEALGKAGVPKERIEKEIIRMLATDIIYEPKAGHYAHLAP